MGIQHTKHYPIITKYDIRLSENSLSADWETKGKKTGEVHIEEELRQPMGYNTPNDKSPVPIGEKEKYSLSEINNKREYSDATKSKKTYTFPNGQKIQVLKKENITRIRKYNDGKWKLIAYETPDFKWAAEDAYSILSHYDSSGRYSERFLSCPKPLDAGFKLNGIMNPSNIKSYLENIQKKGFQNSFDLSLLTNSEKKIIRSEISSLGFLLEKLSQNILNFAKI